MGRELSEKREEKREEKTEEKRRRCRVCAGCRATNCGECHSCKDMRQFGGLNQSRQACTRRRCMQREREREMQRP